jgi:hypothetical protein
LFANRDQVAYRFPAQILKSNFRMGIILYLFRAFTLVHFACSASYRSQTRVRWKKRQRI